jgi:hypothetical protein
MSYRRTRTYPRSRALQAPAIDMGMGYVAMGDGIVSTATDVLADPCLPNVLALLSDLHAAQQTSSIFGPSSTEPSTPTPGVGLCNAVTPLQILLYTVENPATVALGAAGVLGLLIGIGYILGSD